MKRVRRKPAAALAVALGLITWWLCGASVASADLTERDGAIEAALEGSVADELDTYVSTRTPVIDIKVSEPGWKVECRIGQFGHDESCGTQQTSGCPVDQCWRFSPTLPDGYEEIYVDYLAPKGIPSYLQLQFTVDSTPPDTVLTPPLHGSPTRLNLFDSDYGDNVKPVEDFAGEDKLQCSLSLASKPPGAWGGCGASHLPRLRPHATYRLLARAVDIFGRPDPTPAEYVFSPTPCRVRVVGIPSARSILKHGVKARVHCVQPTAFGINFAFSLSTIRRYYHGYAPPPLSPLVRARTSREGETETITVPGNHLKPIDVKTILGYTRRQKGYRVDLQLYQADWGFPVFVRDLLRR